MLLRLTRYLPLFLLIACAQALAGPFVLFPNAGQLSSPNGQFIVQNIEADRGSSEFVGTFRSLWLSEKTSGRSRKLCDYIGVAAVQWAGNDFLLVTQYVSKRTSRALLFAMSGAQDPIVVDAPTLMRLVPWEQGLSLQQNDHVFVEASRLEGETLHLRVWGYGQRDAKGFRWSCAYKLWNSSASCTPGPDSPGPDSR